ncbi:metal ABC transporter substrate-binding protein [Aeromicrobium chenweiae]|uniref:Zinc ABC transporter substrate-binding protein n=1 Tax=Aeromicrobium chenweiae TaxID=2079793 RepID=A0A2S0WNE6_9ACTN|nr:zinc ABC transporter substrate-binding protein [Aeromicrobium chenweiae]AWB92837.1 zinc ABC transporter substrate-binding protein [Aeromicrobium chenweiae]TGN33831.1 zinc ABC transporter substrate-binding protein [Aeromicrobium chenweiae]
MRKSLSLLAIAPLVTLLAACGATANDDGRTRVVASFYPFAFVTEQVGGSFVNVQNLTSPGVEPHDLELKPKQVAAVQDADLVVYEKHFQAAVDEAVDQAGRSTEDTVDADAELDLLPADDEAGEHGEDHADHDHGDEDPHTWLDPTNMVRITEAVAARLSKLDPDHAEDYRANADALVARLKKLDASFTEGLKTCERRTIVTTHAAFKYLANRYDLHQEPIAGIDPTNEPSPSQLGDITKLVKREGITTIFTEELVSPAIADTIAKETGATTATLDPIEGLSDDTSDEDYVSLMEKNLAALQKANSCS